MLVWSQRKLVHNLQGQLWGRKHVASSAKVLQQRRRRVAESRRSGRPCQDTSGSSAGSPLKAEVHKPRGWHLQVFSTSESESPIHQVYSRLLHPSHSVPRSPSTVGHSEAAFRKPSAIGRASLLSFDTACLAVGRRGNPRRVFHLTWSPPRQPTIRPAIRERTTNRATGLISL